jgi:hypothetical protein
VKEISRELEISQQLVTKLTRDARGVGMVEYGNETRGRARTFQVPRQRNEATHEQGAQVEEQTQETTVVEEEHMPTDEEIHEEELHDQHKELGDDPEYVDTESDAADEGTSDEDDEDEVDETSEPAESASVEAERDLRGTPSHIAQARDADVLEVVKSGGATGVSTAFISEQLGVKRSLAYISVCRLRRDSKIHKLSTGTRQPHWTSLDVA